MANSFQAVGMIEFNSIAAGIEASDYMLKAASVEPLMLKTICPGKFVTAIGGDVASVEASVAAGLAAAATTAVDHFVIPNISPVVLPAVAGTAPAAPGAALGVIETFSAASSVLAADYAVKAADVNLLDVRIAMGLGGKAFVLLSGDIAAVDASVEAGSQKAAAAGLLVRKVVIPGADPELFRHIA